MFESHQRRETMLKSRLAYPPPTPETVPLMKWVYCQSTKPKQRRQRPYMYEREALEQSEILPRPLGDQFTHGDLDFALYGRFRNRYAIPYMEQKIPENRTKGTCTTYINGKNGPLGMDNRRACNTVAYAQLLTSKNIMKVPDGVPNELYLNVTMQCNQINGVFAKRPLCPGVRYGPYTGRCVHLSEVKIAEDSSHMWEIFLSGQLSHFIDGRGSSANWMTYVRCARSRREQNLHLVQCGSQIFYDVCDVIQRNDELMVWYGDMYELYLGIPIGLKAGSQNTEQTDSGNETLEGNGGGYQCVRCEKVFAYKYYRDKHLKYTRCVDQGNRKFPCHLCLRSFEKRDRLRIHVLHVHEKHRPHKCHVCQKSFSQSSSLNKHMRVHSGERPYKCVYCSKSFTASSILRTHIRQHSGEKPFKCKFCWKPFASHAAHDSHVRRTHAEENVVCGVPKINCKLSSDDQLGNEVAISSATERDERLDPPSSGFCEVRDLSPIPGDLDEDIIEVVD